MTILSAVSVPWAGWWPWWTYAMSVSALAGHRTWMSVSTWTFRRNVLSPVSAVLDPVIVKDSPSGQGLVHLDIPKNFRDDADAVIRVHVPMDWTPSAADKTRVSTLLQERLSVDKLTATWTLSGRKPYGQFALPAKPPSAVSFADMTATADTAADTEIVMGQGTRGQVVTFDLSQESPHALLGAGSGAGKSELLAWMVGQFMRRGYGVLVLDAKFVSHMWLRRVPGVLYAAESEELHEALVWLDGELLRRARHVSAGGDPAGLTPLVAVLEEMNGATNRLRSYWRTIKAQGDPMMSPALTALANLSAMGREMRVHILMAGQSMTGKATGGAEARESFGARALARATANQWRMLAPQIKPAPVKAGPPGRWHLVVQDSLREFQAPFVDIKGRPERLIEWATRGGKALPDVPAMMLGLGGGGTRIPDVPWSEVPTPGVSLRLAAEALGVELATLTRWRERRSDFPSEIGVGANNTKLYDMDHLRAYVRERGRERVEEVA